MGLLSSRVDIPEGVDGLSIGESMELMELKLKIKAVEYCMDTFGNSNSPEESGAFCNLAKRYVKIYKNFTKEQLTTRALIRKLQ